MKPILALLAVPYAALALSLAAAPSALALNKADRNLCSDATTDPASMLTCMKSLNERLSAIEDGMSSGGGGGDARIAKLESDLAAAKAEIDALKDHSQVQAPFKVVDAAGETLMSVVESNGGAVLTVGTESAHARMTADAEGVFVAASMNGSAARLEASGERVVVDAGDSAHTWYTSMGKGVGGFNGFSLLKDSHDAANMGIEPGKAAAVRVFNDAGVKVASIGSNQAEGGAGAVMLSADSKNAVAIVSKSGGDGQIQLSGTSGEVALQMRGGTNAYQVLSKGGVAVGEFALSTAGGAKLVLGNPGGDAAFWAGYATDGGGMGCIKSPNAKTYCLGPSLPLQ